MSLRIALRALFSVVLVLLAAPALIAVASELGAGAPEATTFSGIVVGEHGDDFAANTERRYLTLVTASDRFSLAGPGAAWTKPGLHVRVSGRLDGGTITLADRNSVETNTWDKLSGA